MTGIHTIGPEYEAFGTRFADSLVDQKMSHRGLNADGHPVGHTVDSVSATGTVAAEYSAEEGYFKSPFVKLFKDLRHSRESHPQAERILLLSSKECGPKAHTQLVNLAARLKRWLRIDLEIYDSRRQAEHIVDCILLDDKAVDTLSPYLAPLEKVRAEFAATHLLPKLVTGYVQQGQVERELQDRVTNSRVATLSGISGSGKSETAVAVATALQAGFETVIWVPAGEIREENDLNAVSVERRVHKLNLLHWLRDRSCLVVLDNLTARLSSEELRQYCSSKSAVIVTRQVSVEGDMRMPLLERTEARSLLEQGVGRCPDDVFEVVWKTVGGHPMALRLMNSGVRSSSWEDLKEDCAAIGEYLDEDGLQRLADRLLERLRPVVERELALFLWCKSARLDRSFARFVLKPVGLRKLDEACLLAADRKDVARLHDIVYASAHSIKIPTEKYAAEFDAALDSHIEAITLAEGLDLSFLNFIDVHGQMIKALLHEIPGRSTLAYCLAHSSADKDVNRALLGDPAQRSKEILSGGKVKDMDVSAICETIEAIYRKVKYDSGIDAARTELDTNLPIFEELSKAPSISRFSYCTVLHHRAKALRNLKRFDDAIPLCEQVLAEFAHPATKLLLARLLLLKRDNASIERSKELLFELLEEAQVSPEAADISITLAAIETLGWGELKPWFPEALNKFGGLVAECIIESATRMLDHAFLAFASIGRFLQYNAPDQFHLILKALPKRTPEEARDDKERAAWAEILLSASKSDQCPEEDRENIRLEALGFYEALERPSEFSQQEHGQLLFLLNRFDDAIRVLNPLVTNSPNPWNRYWLSKALLAHGDLPVDTDLSAALRLIDESLGDPKGKTYRASFLEHRWEIRKAGKDTSAIDDLQEAHDCCTNQKYKESLAKKLAAERGT